MPKLERLRAIPLRSLTASRALRAVEQATSHPGSRKRIAAGLSAALAASGVSLRLEVHAPQTRSARFLTQAEVARLLRELPAHHIGPAMLGLATGLRAGNIRMLTWSQVQGRFLVFGAGSMKGRREHVVPLSDSALDILEAQRGRHPSWVFPYRGQPVGQLSTRAWREACGRAHLQGLRWHDLRHTWASWHAQEGTPLLALQQLGGWRSVEMVRRYAHFSQAELACHAARVGTLVGTLRKSSAAIVVQVPELRGGAEGDRTLDLRIANATPSTEPKENQ